MTETDALADARGPLSERMRECEQVVVGSLMRRHTNDADAVSALLTALSGFAIDAQELEDERDTDEQALEWVADYVLPEDAAWSDSEDLVQQVRERMNELLSERDVLADHVGTLESRHTTDAERIAELEQRNAALTESLERANAMVVDFYGATPTALVTELNAAEAERDTLREQARAARQVVAGDGE